MGARCRPAVVRWHDIPNPAFERFCAWTFESVVVPATDLDLSPHQAFSTDRRLNSRPRSCYKLPSYGRIRYSSLTSQHQGISLGAQPGKAGWNTWLVLSQTQDPKTQSVFD